MTAGPGTARETGRDPFFDNAKLLAIVLVVMGHAWQPLKDSRAVSAGYLFVYTFHMPVFILIAGHLSRSFEYRPGQTRRLITGIAVPYAVFETVYTLYGNAVDDRGNDISLFQPWYLTWFLMALLAWRVTAPVWLAMRRRVALGASVAVALAGTASEIGSAFSLDRVLQFLPFFVAGLLLRPGDWERLRAPGARAAAVPVLLGGVALAYWVQDKGVSSEWAVRSRSWGELGVPWTTGLPASLGLLAGSSLLVAAFLAWVPRRRTWFTALGEGTLYTYLLHGLVIRTAAWEGWYDRPFWHTPAGELAVTALAVALALALSSPPVRRALRPLVEPRLDWAFRRTPPAPPAPAAPAPAPRTAEAAGR
ncbi:acyltransferase family protein [Streptomyces capparidis]